MRMGMVHKAGGGGGRNQRKVTKLKERGGGEKGKNYAKMLDISEPKKGEREEAKITGTGAGKLRQVGGLDPPATLLPQLGQYLKCA